MNTWTNWLFQSVSDIFFLHFIVSLDTENARVIHIFISFNSLWFKRETITFNQNLYMTWLDRETSSIRRYNLHTWHGTGTGTAMQSRNQFKHYFLIKEFGNSFRLSAQLSRSSHGQIARARAHTYFVERKRSDKMTETNSGGSPCFERHDLYISRSVSLRSAKPLANNINIDSVDAVPF